VALKRNGREARSPSLGHELRELREELELSLRETSLRSGGVVSGPGVHRIESGTRYPNLRTLEALVAVYGATIVIDPERTTITRRQA
jgi:transcriptional regulator with XRE-family HTH domain